MKKVSNVLDLRNDLLTVYEDLRTGKLGTSEVKQAANVAGKILSSASLQIEYNKMTQSKKKIAFLEVSE
jgi:hypothetical protein